MTQEPKSRHDLAHSCRVLSDAMLDLATDLDFYGGFGLTLQAKTAQLMASGLAVMAKTIEERRE